MYVCMQADSRNQLARAYEETRRDLEQAHKSYKELEARCAEVFKQHSTYEAQIQELLDNLAASNMSNSGLIYPLGLAVFLLGSQL